MNIPRERVYIGVGVEEIQHICKLYDRSQITDAKLPIDCFVNTYSAWIVDP